MTPLVRELIRAFRGLPGIGPRSAQRLVLQLLQRRKQAGLHLAQVLETAIRSVRHCVQCRNLTEADLCEVCSDCSRDPSLLCVVSSPADLLAVEQTGGYRGQYFVLMGVLSPVQGLGPEELGLPHLKERIAHPTCLDRRVRELIVATNPTVEGEATAYYIQQMCKDTPVRISRLAHGVPLGGEIEYIDGGTLLQAISGRVVMEEE